MIERGKKPRARRSQPGQLIEKHDAAFAVRLDMADYTRPLFRHKFSKTQAMADYERLSSSPGRRESDIPGFDVQVTGAWRAVPLNEGRAHPWFS
jgi:hypothetical protein